MTWENSSCGLDLIYNAKLYCLYYASNTHADYNGGLFNRKTWYLRTIPAIL